MVKSSLVGSLSSILMRSFLPLLVALDATTFRPWALYLFVEVVRFLIEARHLGFLRLSAPQFFECLADRKFGCFRHRDILWFVYFPTSSLSVIC